MPSSRPCTQTSSAPSTSSSAAAELGCQPLRPGRLDRGAGQRRADPGRPRTRAAKFAASAFGKDVPQPPRRPGRACCASSWSTGLVRTTRRSCPLRDHVVPSRRVAAAVERHEPVDWVYVDDVVDALRRGGRTDDALGETIDVGSGTLTSVRSVVEEIVRLMDSSVEPGFGALPERPNERVRVADVERAQAPARAGPAYAARPGARAPRSTGIARARLMPRESPRHRSSRLHRLGARADAARRRP